MCMGKINLKASLISSEENLNIETTGIKTDNKIIYKENNITVTILIFNNKIEMNRTCNEYKINLVFEKQKSGQETILAATQNSANTDVRSVERKGNVDLLTKASKGENGELCFFLLK